MDFSKISEMVEETKSSVIVTERDKQDYNDLIKVLKKSTFINLFDSINFYEIHEEIMDIMKEGESYNGMIENLLFALEVKLSGFRNEGMENLIGYINNNFIVRKSSEFTSIEPVSPSDIRIACLYLILVITDTGEMGIINDIPKQESVSGTRNTIHTTEGMIGDEFHTKTFGDIISYRWNGSEWDRVDCDIEIRNTDFSKDSYFLFERILMAETTFYVEGFDGVYKVYSVSGAEGEVLSIRLSNIANGKLVNITKDVRIKLTTTNV